MEANEKVSCNADSSTGSDDSSEKPKPSLPSERNDETKCSHEPTDQKGEADSPSSMSALMKLAEIACEESGKSLDDDSNPSTADKDSLAKDKIKEVSEDTPNNTTSHSSKQKEITNTSTVNEEMNTPSFDITDVPFGQVRDDTTCQGDGNIKDASLKTMVENAGNNDSQSGILQASSDKSERLSQKEPPLDTCDQDVEPAVKKSQTECHELTASLEPTQISQTNESNNLLNSSSKILQEHSKGSEKSEENFPCECTTNVGDLEVEDRSVTINLVELQKIKDKSVSLSSTVNSTSDENIQDIDTSDQIEKCKLETEQIRGDLKDLTVKSTTELESTLEEMDQLHDDKNPSTSDLGEVTLEIDTKDQKLEEKRDTTNTELEDEQKDPHCNESKNEESTDDFLMVENHSSTEVCLLDLEGKESKSGEDKGAEGSTADTKGDSLDDGELETVTSVEHCVEGKSPQSNITSDNADDQAKMVLQEVSNEQNSDDFVESEGMSKNIGQGHDKSELEHIVNAENLEKGKTSDTLQTVDVELKDIDDPLETFSEEHKQADCEKDSVDCVVVEDIKKISGQKCSNAQLENVLKGQSSDAVERGMQSNTSTTPVLFKHISNQSEVFAEEETEIGENEAPFPNPKASKGKNSTNEPMSMVSTNLHRGISALPSVKEVLKLGPKISHDLNSNDGMPIPDKLNGSEKSQDTLWSKHKSAQEGIDDDGQIVAISNATKRKAQSLDSAEAPRKKARTHEPSPGVKTLSAMAPNSSGKASNCNSRTKKCISITVLREKLEKNLVPHDTGPPDTFICSRCRCIWNDEVLRSLFVGDDMVTVNSHISYGAIILIVQFARNHYPQTFEKDVRELLGRADFSGHIDSIGISDLDKGLRLYIKDKSLACCSPFRPVEKIKRRFVPTMTTDFLIDLYNNFNRIILLCFGISKQALPNNVKPFFLRMTSGVDIKPTCGDMKLICEEFRSSDDLSLEQYFNFIFCLMNSCGKVLLVPNGELLQSLVLDIEESMLNLEWDSEDLFSAKKISEVPESQDKPPTVRDVLTKFCFYRNFPRYSSKLPALVQVMKDLMEPSSVKDCVGTSVAFYKQYCDFAFYQREIEKAAVFLNLYSYGPNAKIPGISMRSVDPTLSCILNSYSSIEEILDHCHAQMGRDKRTKFSVSKEILNASIDVLSKKRNTTLEEILPEHINIIESYIKDKVEQTPVPRENADETMKLLIKRLLKENVDASNFPLIIHRLYTEVLLRPCPPIPPLSEILSYTM